MDGSGQVFLLGVLFLGGSITGGCGARLMTGSKFKPITLAIALPDEKWF